MFRIFFFFLENHASNKIMWKNTVVPGRPQMIIWLMCTSRWYLRLKHTIRICISWLHRASIILNPLLLPTDAHNVKKRRVIKTF